VCTVNIKLFSAFCGIHLTQFKRHPSGTEGVATVTDKSQSLGCAYS